VRTATRRLAVAAPLNAHQAVGITVEVPVNAAAELHLPASAVPGSWCRGGRSRDAETWP
jgi:hypothetical protein